MHGVTANKALVDVGDGETANKIRGFFKLLQRHSSAQPIRPEAGEPRRYRKGRKLQPRKLGPPPSLCPYTVRFVSESEVGLAAVKHISLRYAGAGRRRGRA